MTDCEAESALPPESLDALLERAHRLAGRTLSELAGPALDDRGGATNLVHHKGFAGTLLEALLGATAGSKDAPDFPELGTELKTLPVSAGGIVREATYVCRVSFRGVADERWETSRVRRKLSQVLFVPIESERGLPLGRRRVGTPILFRLEGEAERVIRSDWEHLTGLLATGDAADLDSRLGQALHVRPKGKNRRVQSLAPAADGGSIRANPKGFYLRPQFTSGVLRTSLGQPSPRPHRPVQ